MLGRAEGTSYTVAPHKLMIFYNTNLKVYLENTTLGSYNQPAEYKVVAEITKGGITKKIELTLTDRGPMEYTMLIGRKALGRRWVVNPSISFSTKPDGKKVIK